MKHFHRSKLVLTLTTILMIAVAAAIPLLGTTRHTHAQDTVPITEFPIPTSNSAPMYIASGPDGNVWFTEFSSNKIGKITPDGTITEYSLPSCLCGVDLPIGITSGPDGNIWFTTNQGHIGKITADGTTVTVYSSLDSSESDGIISGPDGNLWFTHSDGKIGKITPDGMATEYFIDPSSPGYTHNATGITSGPDGNLWFTDNKYDNNTSKWVAAWIGKITTNGTITEYAIPTSNGTTYGITSGPDGNIWFTEYNGQKIGKITTSGVITEYATPTSSSFPQGITSGSDGNLWSAENGGVGKITTSGVITEYATPTSNSGTFSITSGSDGNLWFVEHHANKIGQVNLSFSVGQITASPNPVQINQSVNASANFTDKSGTTHTASWNWGDGTTSAGTVTEPNGSNPGTVGPDSHTYTTAGVYTITLTVTNNAGISGSSTFQYVSVYNPTPQGLFSAGHHFDSPQGAYLQNPSLTGRVSFGLSYTYQGTMPVGNKEFIMNFNAANLTFNATTVSSLVIANGMGTLTGTGTVNGSGTYNFLVTGSEGANTIRIQITDASGNVVYDTQPGATTTATPTTSVQGHVLAH